MNFHINNQVPSNNPVLNGFLTSTISSTNVTCSKVAKQVLSKMAECIKKNPKVAVLVGTITVLVGVTVFHMLNTTNQSKEIQKLLNKITDEIDDELIQNFVDILFKLEDFITSVSAEGLHEENKRFLAQKISLILRRENGIQNQDIKAEIIDNAINNFKSMMIRARNRIARDMTKLNIFGVHPNSTLKKITALGIETHRQGRLPLKVEFDNGIVIIYKPRSVAIEEALYEPKKGILASHELGQYHVADCGKYGYCGYLENIGEENQIIDIDDLKAYLQKYARIEIFGKGLGLSDLHYQNFITVDKTPIIIDAEVFANPSGIPTGILEDSGPIQLFGYPKNLGKNFVHFDDFQITGSDIQNFLNEVRDCNGIRDESLRKIGINLEQIFKDAGTLENELMKKIKLIKQQLTDHVRPRIILLNTGELNTILELINPDLEDSNHPNSIDQGFIGRLKELEQEQLKQIEQGQSDQPLIFKFRCQNEAKLRMLFKEDLLNDDVPIFYYYPDLENPDDQGWVFYGNLCIGSYERPGLVAQSTYEEDRAAALIEEEREEHGLL